MAALYPDLDLAVVASHSENCGGAVEPLLCGVPVVATNVGGLPDLIRDGETGWLVPPKNPEALARAMLEALQDKQEARRRTSKARSSSRKLFDVERTARGVAEIYDEILRASSSAALAHGRFFNQSPERGKRTPEFVPIRLSRRRLF